MTQQGWTKRVDELFQWALASTAPCPALAALHHLLIAGQARLQAPMRVAIIGRVKAGKSTAMNALLGHPVVPTGETEVTFNVTWFQWGDTPAVHVHYKDGRPAQPRPFAELEALTRRSNERLAELLAIDYLAVTYPHALLQRLNLVDTPGLASYYVDDSENARRFTRMTEQEGARVDAVLYLFERSIADTEQKVVEEFVGPAMGSMTPLNAIGVLTMVDAYWPSEAAPMSAAARVVERRWALPPVRRTLYRIVPFCGLLALGAQTLTPDEFAALTRLAGLSQERFAQLINNARRFVMMTDADLPVTPTERQQLLARLGWYGVWLACQRIRAGVTEQQQLASELVEHSGLPQLRQLILSHFGNRAFLLKLDRILRQVLALDLHLRPRVAAADQAVLHEVITRFEALKTELHPVRELGVLCHYYDGRLRLSPEEVEMLLQVTGETGTTCGERLGLPGAAPEALLQVAEARSHYWRALTVEAGSDPVTAEAARVLDRSYELLAYHVREASRHLAIAQQHLDFVL